MLRPAIAFGGGYMNEAEKEEEAVQRLRKVQKDLEAAHFVLAAKLMDMFLKKQGGTTWYHIGGAQYGDAFRSNPEFRAAFAQYAANAAASKISAYELPGQAEVPQARLDQRVTNLPKRSATYRVRDVLPFPHQSKAAFSVEHLRPMDALLPYGWRNDAAWGAGTGWFGIQNADLYIQPIASRHLALPQLLVRFKAEIVQADKFSFPPTGTRNLIPDYAAGVYLESHRGYGAVRHYESWHDSIEFVLQMQRLSDGALIISTEPLLVR